jgi:acyl-homoserine-lactone acylase
MRKLPPAAIALVLSLSLANPPLAPALASASATAPAGGARSTHSHSSAGGSERARLEAEARAVEITRDPWGIAHVRAPTDAGAVFGAMYAQAEDDFHRIERNYLVALGRLAEAEGDSGLYSDLRQRMFVDPAQLRTLYTRSPFWLRSLMQSWADGLNYYLATHPETRPRVLAHFEPWMALSFTEGSIGGDIESVDLDALAAFYGSAPPRTASSTAPRLRPSDPAFRGPGGSNGFAIAPSRSASGHALLWINPHTSFYFRSELQMTSAAGLDVYGAATWGQFFIYQGFNEHNGWMHTSYGGDAIDEYAERIVETPKGRFYRYAGGLRPLEAGRIVIQVKRAGRLTPVAFTAFRTHHGPIVRAENGRWIAVRIFQDPVRALSQSYLRTKTTDYASFRRIQDMRTDTSNNTVYADADGTIAYFHGNFIPRRDARFDFTRPVDGSDPATEWHGAHRLEETITLLNPPNGWIQNTNNWPFSAAGAASPKREDYPAYMWMRGENPRGLHAVDLLKDIRDVTLDSLIATGYDPHLTAFDVLLPPLLGAYDRLSADDPRHAALEGPISTLTAWDHRTSAESVGTALAIFWGNQLTDAVEPRAREAHQPVYDYLVDHLSDGERLDALSAAVARLTHDFGGWKVAWGEINRFQRLTDDIVQPFDDSKPSLAVGMAPSDWGALASFESEPPQTTRRIYGSVGNSFVAAVEFGPTVRAKAIMTGGESGDPASAHFTDQAAAYVQGRFRDVLFTPQDIAAHSERRYHPGEP